MGVTDRTMRRWRDRLNEHGYSGLWNYRQRSTARDTRHRTELHVGEDGAANSRSGKAADLTGQDAAHRWQRASLVWR